ncbi:MAG: Rrf2 family transcriptional regulator [Bauldia sp.]|nr:Rrf2 family transcriptional regulator [Bauldia sp.]
MRLDPQTDYAIRILLFLASTDGCSTSLAVIAAKLNVSRGYVAKLVTSLMKNGLVVSHRGRAGGLELQRRASDISIGDVLRAVERSTALVECQDDRRACSSDNQCVFVTMCRLPAYLKRAAASFFVELDRVTLADILSVPIEQRVMPQYPLR